MAARKTSSSTSRSASGRTDAPTEKDAAVDVDWLADTWGNWSDEQRKVYDALDPDTQAEVKAEMKRRAQA